MRSLALGAALAALVLGMAGAAQADPPVSTRNTWNDNTIFMAQNDTLLDYVAINYVDEDSTADHLAYMRLKLDSLFVDADSTADLSALIRLKLDSLYAETHVDSVGPATGMTFTIAANDSAKKWLGDGTWAQFTVYAGYGTWKAKCDGCGGAADVMADTMFTNFQRSFNIPLAAVAFGDSLVFYSGAAGATVNFNWEAARP